MLAVVRGGWAGGWLIFVCCCPVCRQVETFLRKWAPAVRSKGKVLAPAEAK